MTAPGFRLPPIDTLGRWRREAARGLREAGIESARVEADLIARHVLGCGHADLIAGRDRRLGPSDRRRLSRLLHKRLTRIPLQYLFGEVDFGGLTLKVTPAVLIPRPETEGLVERVLRFLPAGETAWVLDVGTGSGCIALAIASARPGVRLIATELSTAAARVARSNARRTGLSGRVRVLEGDLLEPVTRAARKTSQPGEGRFRVVVSNPPYVAPGDRSRLPPEVVDHEPHRALFADRQGTSVIRRLATEAAGVLEPGGLLALEIGEDQGPRVARILDAVRAGGNRAYEGIEIENDLAGRVRYALARRTMGTGRRRGAGEPGDTV